VLTLDLPGTSVHFIVRLVPVVSAVVEQWRDYRETFCLPKPRIWSSTINLVIVIIRPPDV